METYKRLAINACLAGFWAAVAVVTASDQPFSKAVVVAAITAAVRVAVGLIADKLGHTVPVDA